MSRLCRAFGLVGLLLIAGCQGSARHVVTTGDGGVIAMPSNSDLNRKRAEELMAKRFPQGYVIEREEEVVVGQTTTTRDDARTISEDLIGSKKKVAGSLDTTIATRTTSTQDQTEYRIIYRRAPAQ